MCDSRVLLAPQLQRIRDANANTMAALQGQHEFTKDAILAQAKAQAEKEMAEQAAKERQARVDMERSTGLSKPLRPLGLARAWGW